MRKKKKIKKFSLGSSCSAALKRCQQGFRRFLPLAVLSAVIFFSFQGIREHLFADMFFNLASIRTETDGILTRDDIIRTAGVRRGDNILSVSLPEITRRLESDHRIRQAVVERELPNALLLKVKERREFLRARLSDQGPLMVIDEEGVLLGPAGQESSRPVFQDLRAGAAQLFKNQRYQDVSLLKDIFAISEKLSSEPLLQGRRIEQISVHAYENIAITVERGLEIRLDKDFRDDLKKLELMRPVLSKEIEELAYLDLRYKNPVAKRKPASPVKKK